MSGVGKTRLSNMLRSRHWFHYSGDYRIGTRYLDEPILDNIKQQAMQVPFLRDLLLSDSISIRNKITFDHLKPLSTFLGKVGNPEMDGLALAEFQSRQALHCEAEIQAMLDVPDFIHKAENLYGYSHFINDAGGSLCELDDPRVMPVLAEHTLILYLQATKDNEKTLIERAERSPKPLYYRPDFLEEQLSIFMHERELDYVAMVNPDEFVRWVFPRLFYSRLPRYEALANDYGYSVTTEELFRVSSEEQWLTLLETAIARHPDNGA